jgi:murein DD-endopeptidase MepM/ murein hydrolase activator NlpD
MRTTWTLRGMILFAVAVVLAFSPGCRPGAKPKAKAETPVPVESLKCVPLARGDIPSVVIKHLGLPISRVERIVGALDEFGVGSQKCAAGESLVGFYRDDNLYRLEYRQRYDQTFIVFLDSTRTRLANGYHWVRVEPTVYCGAIRSSLWGSMIRIGQKPDMIMRFADLFSWDVDFFSETQPGDSFKLLTEQLYCDDRRIGGERLIVGEYKGRAGEYYGYFYEDPTGHRDYYTHDGQAVRKGFLRSPLQFSKVTSSFSTGRYHPILRIVRPHNGVDYAASTGTPVSAIGDGVVTQCGWAGGYGRLVQINHYGGYSSRYGHLSRFGRIRAGGRVSQGTIIGYVGTTGMSTGPHLHFEVRINGAPVNPLRVIPPRAPPLAKAYLPAFRARADSLSTLLRAAGPTREDKSAPPDSAAAVDSTSLTREQEH